MAPEIERPTYTREFFWDYEQRCYIARVSYMEGRRSLQLQVKPGEPAQEAFRWLEKRLDWSWRVEHDLPWEHDGVLGKGKEILNATRFEG